jgi:integrase
VRDAVGRLIPAHVARAKREAIELSSRLIKGHGPTSQLTVDALFRLFEREVLPGHSPRHRTETERQLELWRTFLGPRFVVSRFGLREWNAFIRQRREGEIDARGQRVHDPKRRKPVGTRSVAKSLKVLRQALRFAASFRVPTGGFLLDSDPTRGLPIPSQANPKRPVADSERFQHLLEVADQVGMYDPDRHRTRSYLRELLILAEGTGRRIGAILALRWSDWEPDARPYGVLHWRAEHDKVGRDWATPVTREVQAALERLRKERLALGDGLILAAPGDADRAVTRHAVTSWLRRAEHLAGLEHLPGGAWHAFRRAWASKRKHLSVKDVAYAGGWKDTSTLLRCYQQPDPETIEQVVFGGRRLRMVR